MDNRRLLNIIREAEYNGYTELDLSKKGITKLPPEIGRLNKLKTLYLYSNQLTNLPREIGSLISLEKLRLQDNSLKNLPAEIGNLTRLQTLWLQGNQLKTVPAEIGNLTRLRELVLYNNQLTNIPSELGNLLYLQKLWVQGNQLTNVPVEIGELINLNELYLSHNKLTELPNQVGTLINLIKLELRNNCLTAIPVDLGKLDNLKILVLDDNPITSPPIEIAHRGAEAIKNYLRQLQDAGEEIKLYEAKLLIVGSGGVGKTFLANRLMYEKLPESEGTTRGIDIHTWIIKTEKSDNFRVNFWDFGGQQILHSTHQFFLTKRSLYLFIWDARKDENQTNFDYWLNIIKLLSDNSPVLVVMNKADERIKNIDENTLQHTFQNIHGYYKVSAKDNTGINGLREHICREINNLELVGTRLPKAWADIRARLENLGKTYIQCQECLEICDKYGLSEEQAYYLSSYYHDLGVILHFKDNPVLKTIVFLHPEWTTEAVYKIVEDLEIQEVNGFFSYEQVQSIWKYNGYPQEIHPQLLELMKKFELCFQLDSTNNYIVPELLPGNRPNFLWGDQDTLWFLYKYSFMPAGILTRLIVRLHDLHKDKLYWKHGVILEWESDTHAQVVSEPINRLIRIRIKGTKPRELLAVIRRNLNQIHETLNNPEVSQMLPCICSECIQNMDPYLHRYQDLIKAKEKKRKTTECKKSYEDVYIDDMLGKYIFKKDRKYDVFLCHNSKDKNIVKKIGQKLKKNGLHPWLDEWELQPGLPWQKTLEDQIENIKSAAVFIGSNGIGPWQDIEQKAFINEFTKRECPVIPVILHNCTDTPTLPPFLNLFHLVDFRKPNPDPMQQLIWGITGKKP